MPKPLFFCVEKDEVIVCDALKQRYFSLEKEYIERLLYKNSNNSTNPRIEQDLLDSGIIDSGKDLHTSEQWLGDPISRYAHYGSRITSDEQPILSPEALFSEYADLSCNAVVPERVIPNSQKVIPLPSPNLEALKNLSLWDSFLKRKTSRQFFRKPVSLDILSTIFYSCFASIHGDNWSEFSEKAQDFWQEEINLLLKSGVTVF